MTAPSQNPEAAGLEYYGYRVFNAGIGVCCLVAKPGLNDTNPEPLVTAASAQAAIDAEKARADRLAETEGDLTERGEACLSLLPSCGGAMAKARIMGKAQAYLHAAELVRTALQQERQK